jgi:uncharacterized membrane protein YdfJ with MMPL/SSD domain
MIAARCASGRVGRPHRTVVDIAAALSADRDPLSSGCASNHTIRSHIALVFGFVIALAFLLLLVTFRSIVNPLKAVVLNLLSAAAAYGVLVAVFQHG